MNDNGEILFSASEMGNRIAARRKQLGMTQEQVAELAGLSHQFFSSVEAGKKNMRAENVVKLCKALNVSTDFILTGRSNAVDIDYLTAMLQQLDERHFRCAEEIIKNLQALCRITEE